MAINISGDFFGQPTITKKQPLCFGLLIVYPAQRKKLKALFSFAKRVKIDYIFGSANQAEDAICILLNHPLTQRLAGHDPARCMV
ncbi:MAG: hypothetical protein Q8R26_04055 [bacterium]|nr:hypothetical protein [bacterium]